MVWQRLIDWAVERYAPFGAISPFDPASPNVRCPPSCAVPGGVGE